MELKPNEISKERNIRVKHKLIDISLGMVFLLCFTCFLLWLRGSFYTSTYNSQQISARPGDDEFDSSLSRLNTMDKLKAYCDSFYKASLPGRSFPGIVSEVMRKKFYHNYSYYGIKENGMGVLLSVFFGKGVTAIVIPDDIVKYPYAACSQQSIVGMELFKREKYPVRKVAMFDTVTNSGHFAYEVYYEDGWHFFDTDQEPDAELLREYKRPSAAFLASHSDIVLQAYRKQRDPELSKRLIMSYKLGPINKFPAPNAYFFQAVTKYLTWLGWIFFLLVILVRYRVQKKSRISRQRLENKESGVMVVS